MKIINKICFYINFTRDISMYEDIFKKIKSDNVCFIFNDLYKEKQNQNKKEFKRVRIFFKKKFSEYNNLTKLSHVMKSKGKFKVLISAGDLPISKITPKSVLKYFFKKLIFKKNVEIYERKFIEKDISVFPIKFPNNLDRNIKDFPQKSWNKVFDIFFTTLKIEKKLIQKKFGKKKIYTIGFPKLDKKANNKKLKTEIIEQFKLNPRKKIILYLPTLSNAQDRVLIDRIIYDLKKLEIKYNIVLRPHPKYKDLNRPNYNLIKKSKLKLDLLDGRNTADLIKISDYIITDGGSTVLETIYLKKKIFIHNWKKNVNNEKLERRLIDKMRLDNILASKLIKFENLSNFSKILKNTNELNYTNKIRILSEKIFFQNRRVNIIEQLNHYLQDK